MHLDEQCVRWFMAVDLFGIQLNQITVTVLLSVYMVVWSIFVFEYFFYLCTYLLCLSLFYTAFSLPDVANKRVQ